MSHSNEVLVIGAGVSGLTTAVCLAERGVPVRVVAARAPGETTSAVAGALISGQTNGDPADPSTEWNRVTIAEFTKLADETGAGVRLARGRMATPGEAIPGWAVALAGFRPCDPDEIAGFPVAFWLESPIVDMPRYLAWMAGRAEAAGVKLDIDHIDSLEQARGLAATVVNCAGLGASQLAGDPRMMPVRGQHVLTANPGLDEFFYERSPQPTVTSYIPHGDRLVLGGTIERGNGEMAPDPEQTTSILARCAAIEPRIVGAEVTGVDVGLRPGRASVRLEVEAGADGRVVHNYGHAGVGVALSWGCARDAARLVMAGR